MIEVDPRAREGIDALSKLISQVDKKTDGEEVISHLLSEIGSVRSLFECVSEDLISRHSVGKMRRGRWISLMILRATPCARRWGRART